MDEMAFDTGSEGMWKTDKFARVQLHQN